MTTKLRLRQKFLAMLLATCLCSPVWATGNPDLVGILASVTDPANAAELGLSEEQIAKLEALIKQHESKALDFASQLRGLPAKERRFKEMENVRLVEKQGFAFLTEAQQVAAEKWRLQKAGPMALLDPETASKFGLTEEQSNALGNVLEGRVALVRSLGSSEKADEEIRKRFLEVLTSEQRDSWNVAVGKEKTAPAAQDSPSDLANPAVGSSGAPAQDMKAAANGTNESPVAGGAGGLLLNFNAAPWAEVLKFVAKEADLNLQADSYPPGTFSYSAPRRRYSVAQAIDIMNGALLDKGFTLIQKNGVIKSVDLTAGESPEQIRGLIREYAELVDPKELDTRGEYEFLKCVFSLERTSVEEIEKEVKLMISPQGSVVPLPTSGQILITDLGGKLRLIHNTIERSENPDASRSNKVVRLSLKHISADEVLAVARPLLGLKELANTSDDISVSMDAFGNTLFATGTPDKMQKLRDIVKELDVKPEDTGTTVAASEQPVVRSHQLLGSDPTTTMDVLQSSFAGQPNINMAMDPKTNNIIVKATPTDHEFIDKLIAELAGQSSQFEIIPLGSIDAQAALLTLEKLYGKPAKASDAATAKGPIYYADPTSRRLMVKGTRQEVEQIKMLIGKIEESAPKMDSLGEGVRVLPIRGKAAERLLQQIDILRKASKSRINIKMPPGSKPASTKEDEAPAEQPSKPTTQVAPRSLERFTSLSLQEEGAPSNDPPQDPAVVSTGEGEIIVMEGPTGLVFASDDLKALSELDQLVRTAQEQMATGPAEPTIRFLKHIPAAAAAELIRSVIAGEQATAGGGGGLLGDVASSVLGGGGLFGGMFGGGGGGGSSSSNTISGAAVSSDVVITPDPRLNALWIQASPLDSLFIEDLILAMDIEGSEVTQTRGTPRIIYVKNSEVADVEAVVKQVFAPQIAQQAAAGGNAQRPPSPEEFINLLRGGGGNRRGGGGGGQSELKEQTMTISSDKKNNALIVVAPMQLFKQVEELVSRMDDAAAADEQTIRTLPLDGTINPTVVQNALTSVFGSSVKTSSTSNPTATTPTGTGGNTQPFNFQQFQNRARGGGGNPFGGGGFNPFGGGAGGQQFRQGGGGNPFGGGGFQGGGNRGGGNNNNRGGGGGNRGGNRN